MALRSRRPIFLLLFTALCWSSSFAFIKIAVEEMHPATLTFLRCVIGGVPLIAVAVWRRRRSGIAVARFSRRTLVDLTALGVMTGIPLTFIGLAERHIDSNLAGIVNATVPIWATLLALRWDAQHRTTPMRLAGVAIGFGGVVALIAARGSIGGAAEVGGLLAVVCATLIYAGSGIFARERLQGVPPVEQAAWSVGVGALVLVPFIVAGGHIPTEVGGAALASTLALGVIGTFLGFLGYYELLAEVGAARASQVTFLMPPLAVIYGALLLHEPIGLEALAAMALILTGVWIGLRAGRTGTPEQVAAACEVGAPR